MSFDHVAFLKTVTQRPGIYQMLDEAGAVLYVGKARNLRKRLASYFRASGLPIKTQALVARIAAIDVTVTESEIEALLLEQNLIKQNRPPFNILLRDDKSYPYILLTDKDRYPRLGFHRGAKNRPGSYFGPYPSGSAVRDSLAFLQKTFRVRQCEDSVFRNRSRPCLQYQIDRCTGPCVGLISEEDYERDVRHTRMFLEGRNRALADELQREMEAASEQLNFEAAAVLRDQLQSLRQIQAEQVIETGNNNCDVVACALEGDQSCVHILFIRRGRVLGSRSYYPKVPLATTPDEQLADFLPQFYLVNRHFDVPGEILLSHEPEDGAVLADALSQQSNRKVRLTSRVRGHRARWLDLASRTAQLNLASRLALKNNQVQRLEALGRSLELDEPPQRLECFDVSHSHGEATVASCVVFDQGGPAKSDYRRFNIEDVTAGDDYAAMEQALRRRYTRLQRGEGKLPDVLFIDGGKGQLRRAQAVLDELGVNGVLLIGVAKGTARKAGMETLLLSEGQNEREIIVEPAALLLIQQIRDEAHRFAITGNQQRVARKRSQSLLEGIPGIGAKRRRELINHFGGARAVENATIAELARVPGISRKLAETIYSALHNE